MPRHEKTWYLPMIVAFLSDDVPRLIGVPPSALARDVSTLLRRTAEEGESFLTISLPKLGKSVDFALQERSPLATEGFRKRNPRSVLPAFMQVVLRRIFNDDGSLVDTPCINSITVIRQLCYWCKKVEKGYSDESLRKAISTLIDVDNALPSLPNVGNHRYLDRARELVEHIFGNSFQIAFASPKHGPGSVAWKGDLLEKRMMNTSYRNLERVFRPIPWFRSLREASQAPDEIYGRPRCDYGVSRIAFVEKDSSGPRVIGLEPSEYMWCQQAIKAWMYNHIENHPTTKGRINFTDQTINRSLTSFWSLYDTLDMSSASDRVSYELVKYLFERTSLWPALDASRTPGTVLPDGRLLMYKKFAPMGSAVCFPVEAVVFYALTVATLIEHGYPTLLATKNTFVYGDDIIVPHGFYTHLERNFELVGLKFSSQKCCISGKFRESCGLDAYDGVDVTPLRLRHPHVKSAADLTSLIEHRNMLYSRKYWASAAVLKEQIISLYFRDFGIKRIPCSPRTDLPFLAWLDNECDSVTYKYRNWIRYAKGWHLVPQKQDAPEKYDTFFLRESLCHGGPVGTFSVCRGQKVRKLTKRFASSLKRKQFAV